MTTEEISYLIAGVCFFAIGVVLVIVKIVLNLRAVREQRVSLKEANIGGLAGVWGFTKRHFMMFCIIVCFTFAIASFMGLLFSN